MDKEDLIVKLSIVIFMISLALVLQLNYTGFFVLNTFNNSLVTENLSFTDGITENMIRYINLDKNVNVTSAYLNLTGIDGNYVNQSDGFSIVGAGSNAGNDIYTNGTDFWIIDVDDDFVYHFNSSKANQSDGFNIGDAGVGRAEGIQTNGTDFWVVDATDCFVYHFNSSKANQSDGFFTCSGGTRAGAGNSQGLHTNGTDFFVIDNTDDFVYHFNSSGANQSDGFGIASYGIQGGETGISTHNFLDFWIVDLTDDFVYHISKDYPLRPYLDVGNNSVQEWNHTGYFTLVNNKTANLASAINNFLSNCTAVSGNCSVPFVFHSDTTGIIQYFNIDISYNDTQAPTATLTPSTNKTDVGIGMQTSLSCTATDNIGTPDVKILIDGAQVCSGSGSCSYTHTMATSGDKTVKCQALDRENNNATKSVTLTGTVPQAPAPGPAPAPSPTPSPEPIIFPEEEIKESLPLELTPEIQPITIEDITAEIKENKIVINLQERARLKFSFEEGPRPKPRLDIEFSTKEIPKLKQTVMEIIYIDWHYYFNIGLFVLILSLIINLIVNMIKRN